MFRKFEEFAKVSSAFAHLILYLIFLFYALILLEMYGIIISKGG